MASVVGILVIVVGAVALLFWILARIGKRNLEEEEKQERALLDFNGVQPDTWGTYYVVDPWSGEERALLGIYRTKKAVRVIRSYTKENIRVDLRFDEVIDVRLRERWRPTDDRPNVTEIITSKKFMPSLKLYSEHLYAELRSALGR